MPTARELIDQLNSLEGDEAREAQKLFMNDQGAVVTAARGKIASAAKKEGRSGVGDLEQKLAEAEAKIEELTGDLATAQEKAPELANKVAELTTRLREQERTHRELLKQKDEALVETSREVHVKGLAARLKARKLVDDYADEQAAPKYGKQIRRKADGSGWDVFKPGEDTPYAAETMDEALDLLADDVVSSIRAKSPGLIMTNVDGGGGRGPGGGGSAITPPVKDIAAQKQASGAYAI